MQSVASNATVPNDAVVTAVLKKAMDIQASQAQQLIASIEASVPKPNSTPNPNGAVGQMVDIVV